MTENPQLSDVCLAPQDGPEAMAEELPPEASTSVKGAEEFIAPLEAVMFTKKFWEPGRVLDVKFLEGTAEQKAKIAEWAGIWSEHANLLFAFDSNAEDAEILVKFGPWGNWSFVGTDSLRNRNHDCTLNIHNLIKGTVQHEFGHAIAFVHEHESPAQGIDWNKEAVYRDLGGPPNDWSREKVDHNLFHTYSKSNTQYTAVDQQSVMMYPIPARWTNDGFTVSGKNEVSPIDKAFVGAAYPGATALFAKPEIRTARCRVETGPGTMYNKYYGNSWIMHNPDQSFIEVDFDQETHFEKKRVYDKAELSLVHLTSMAGRSAGSSPIDISVNKVKVQDNYSPPSGNWVSDTFDITDLMEDGRNRIRLDFQSGARTNYWINSLKVVCSGGENLSVG